MEVDPDIRDWHAAFGIPERELLRAETLGSYDLRMVPRIELVDVSRRESKARYLLSVVPFDGLRSVGRFGFSQLYELPLDGAGEHAMRRADGQQFVLRGLRAVGATWTYDSRFATHGWSAAAPGPAELDSDAIDLPAGSYDVYACWHGFAAGAAVRLHVVDVERAAPLADATASGGRAPVATFETSPGCRVTLEVAMNGPALFCGALLRRQDAGEPTSGRSHH
jgi:hypothetical protein